MPYTTYRPTARNFFRATAVLEFLDPLAQIVPPLSFGPCLTLTLFSAVDENAIPTDGDHVVVSDGESRYRQRYVPGAPLPPFHEIIGVSRAIIIPE